MKNKLLFKISFLIATTINIVCPPPTIEQKRAELHALVDWEHVDLPVALNYDYQGRMGMRNQTLNMTPLCHAVALCDNKLVKKLVAAGASVDGIDDAEFTAIDDIRIHLRPVWMARNNLLTLKYLLDLGAKTIPGIQAELDRQAFESSSQVDFGNHSWFGPEAYKMLLSYAINNQLDMLDPKVRDTVNNQMFGQIIRQLNDQCKFGFVRLSDEQKALSLPKKQILYNFLHDKSIPESARKKAIALFRPIYFEQCVLGDLSELESKNPNFGKNGEVSIRSRFELK